MAALSSLCNPWSAKTTDSLPTDDQLFVRAIEHGVLALGHQEARSLLSDAAKAYELYFVEETRFSTFQLSSSTITSTILPRSVLSPSRR